MNNRGAAMWNPSTINGQEILQEGHYTVADGKAVIECSLWQASHHTCTPAEHPNVTTMQCTKDNVPQDCHVHVENDDGRVWLQFLKAGDHKVCIGEFHVTIKVTAPVDPDSRYIQM